MLTGRAPFATNNRKETCDNIVKRIDTDTSPHLSTAGMDFVRELCQNDPADRHGYHQGGIHQHPWFESFSWDRLCDRKITPPIVREVKHATDTSNFESQTNFSDSSILS